MAEFLKIMLTDATEEEQAIFESVEAEFKIITLEDPDKIIEYETLRQYKGKEEI